MAADPGSPGYRQFGSDRTSSSSGPSSGSACTSPGALTSTPRFGARAIRYSASSELERVLARFPARRRFGQERGAMTSSAIDGVLILTVASFELVRTTLALLPFLAPFFPEPFFGVLRLAARRQASAGGRVDRHPFRQRHDLLLQRRRSQTPRRCHTSAGCSCRGQTRSPSTRASEVTSARQHGFHHKRGHSRRSGRTPSPSPQGFPIPEGAATRCSSNSDCNGSRAHRRVREDTALPARRRAATKMIFPAGAVDEWAEDPPQRVVDRARGDTPDRQRDRRRPRSAPAVDVIERRLQPVFAGLPGRQSPAMSP